MVSILSFVAAAVSALEARVARRQAREAVELPTRTKAKVALLDAELASHKATVQVVDMLSTVSAIQRTGLVKDLEPMKARLEKLASEAECYRRRAQSIREQMAAFTSEERLDKYEKIVEESHEIVRFFDTHLLHTEGISKDVDKLRGVLDAAQARLGAVQPRGASDAQPSTPDRQNSGEAGKPDAGSEPG